MDSFEKCRLASERVAWSFEEVLGDLSFDFSKDFLPSSLCGKRLPTWLSDGERRILNQIRGYSYAHIFEFVEEFILKLTCDRAASYVHTDVHAVSAVLNFANEETKHQRMFQLVKDTLAEGLGFQPKELEGKEETARAICEHSPFAVYLVTLTLEWLTQRHYVECFREEVAALDSNYVKVFRLHWTEEAQHARLDALELDALAKGMSEEDIEQAVSEYIGLMQYFISLIAKQDALDLESFESAIGATWSQEQREELLKGMNQEFLWTFVISGIEHTAFQEVYSRVVPAGMISAMELSGVLATEAVWQLAEPSASNGNRTPSKSCGARPSVLVVDDLEYLREFASLALEDLGYEVFTAENGATALELFEMHGRTIELVLLDLTMPDMAGDEVLSLLKAIRPDLPVILSSGHMRSDVVARVPEDQVSLFLQKPYNLIDLESAVQKALSQGRSE